MRGRADDATVLVSNFASRKATLILPILTVVVGGCRRIVIRETPVLGVPDVLERGVESVVRRVSSRSGRGCPSTASASHPAPAGGAMVAIAVVLRARAAAFRVALGPTLLRLTVSIALPARTFPPVRVLRL